MRPTDDHDAPLHDPSGKALFDTTLSPNARLAGISGVRDFVDHLRADPARHSAGVEGTLVNETSFFRDANVFEALSTQILPALIRLRAPARRLRMWSAATATGQEALSLAILVDRLLPRLDRPFPRLPTWDIRIIGTDISHQAIECASRGLFGSSEIHRGLTPQLLDQHFTRRGDEWLVHPRLAALCDFRVVNLCAPLPALPSFDLIMLRNVLLYFSPAERADVLVTMHRQLAPDGYLILGDSEQAEDSSALFQPQRVGGTYVYRRIG
jgi:chemotaxis protein methyltransferase CheR